MITTVVVSRPSRDQTAISKGAAGVLGVYAHVIRFAEDVFAKAIKAV